jgi:methyl-accepting chemotaxis protein
MNRNTMSFTTKIAGSAAALAALLLLTAWFGLHTAGSLRDSFSTIIGREAKALVLAGTMDTAQSNMAAGHRGVVLYSFAKNPAKVAESKDIYRQNLTALQTSIGEIKPLAQTAETRQVIADIETRTGAWDSAFTELEQFASAGNTDAAMTVLSDKILAHYIAIGEDCKKLIATQQAVLEEQNKAADSEYQTARFLLLGLLAMGALTAIGALAFVRSASNELRQVASEMFEGSRQVAAAAGQVASASQSLAQGTSEQAATLEETSSSTSEITAITRKNAENTRTVAGFMEETSRLVHGANQNLGAMMESMKEINGSSERISKIIRVIDEIAFQTNILALNAAVEAARAGEAGMGFAVVADEVRNLAQRSAQAAKDTASLIEESIGKSGEGSRKLELVAKSIQQITGSSAQVKTLVDEIHVGSQEQARGIEQIASAVGQMEQVTQRSAANAEESAAASEEMAGQAQHLHSSVVRLRRIAGENRVSAPPASEPARTNEARDLGTLGASLRAANRPSKAADFAHQSFPLDDSEQHL